MLSGSLAAVTAMTSTGAAVRPCRARSTSQALGVGQMEVEQHEIDGPAGDDLERLGGAERDAGHRETGHALDVGGVHLGDQRVALDDDRPDHRVPAVAGRLFGPSLD
jgi:hypothetical protein